jgi:PBP1b-binding outer membrane lipoprotein LpoB
LAWSAYLVRLEEVVRKKNVETAFNYQKIADEMTAQSAELMVTLKNPGRSSMTEAERLRAMGQANDNMVKALQLHQEADHLI